MDWSRLFHKVDKHWNSYEFSNNFPIIFPNSMGDNILRQQAHFMLLDQFWNSLILIKNRVSSPEDIIGWLVDKTTHVSFRSRKESQEIAAYRTGT